MSQPSRSLLVVVPLVAGLAATTVACGGSGSSSPVKATPFLRIATHIAVAAG